MPAAVPPPPSDDDPLETAWVRVVENWNDADCHRRLVALAATLQRLPEVGQHYRHVRDNDPDPKRREEARTHIDRLFSVALKNLKVAKPLPAARARYVLFLLAASVVAVLLTATFLAAR